MCGLLSLAISAYCNIVTVLSCVEHPSICPFPSDTLVSLAANYTRQTELNISTVIGGVVFDGLEDEDTPLTNATIKIRMNFTMVMDTAVKRVL